MSFQFTRLYKARRAGQSVAWVYTGDFNSRAYTRRDNAIRWLNTQTPNFNSRAYTRRDILMLGFVIDSFNFNSRAYTRRDNLKGKITHANAQFQFTRLYKARRNTKTKWALKTEFQFTRLYKARLKPAKTIITQATFQFTRLYKARHFKNQNRKNGIYFNSRAYTRRDNETATAGAKRGNFNSRAYTRRDHSFLLIYTLPAISIHAPIQGATLMLP